MSRYVHTKMRKHCPVMSLVSKRKAHRIAAVVQRIVVAAWSDVCRAR